RLCQDAAVIAGQQEAPGARRSRLVARASGGGDGAVPGIHSAVADEVTATAAGDPGLLRPMRWWDRIASGLPGLHARSAGLGFEERVPISMRGVSKALGSQQVLQNIDLDVEAGEFFTLLGPSGSGKTTLLMALAGFTTPDAGAVRLGARDVTRLSPHLRDIGI